MKQLNIFNRVGSRNIIAIAVLALVTIGAGSLILTKKQQTLDEYARVDATAQKVLSIPEYKKPVPEVKAIKKIKAKAKQSTKQDLPAVPTIKQAKNDNNKSNGAPSGYVGAPPVCSHLSVTYKDKSATSKTASISAYLLEWQTNAKILSVDWYSGGKFISKTSSNTISRVVEEFEDAQLMKAVIHTNFGTAFEGTARCAESIAYN